MITSIQDRVAVAKLSPFQVDSLAQNMTEKEVILAIDSLKCNKSPDPDSITYKFYRTYKSILAPYLTIVFSQRLWLIDKMIYPPL